VGEFFCDDVARPAATGRIKLVSIHVETRIINSGHQGIPDSARALRARSRLTIVFEKSTVQPFVAKGGKGAERRPFCFKHRQRWTLESVLTPGAGSCHSRHHSGSGVKTFQIP
jgi:hypothetical protein